MTTDAAMGLPPILPNRVMWGMDWNCSCKSSLDSAAPTKPTGMPIIAAGAGVPFETFSSKWNRVVGALPTTTIDRLRSSGQSSTAAADRVVLNSLANSGVFGLLRVQRILFRQERKDFVIDDATASQSVSMVSPALSADVKAGTKLSVARIASAIAGTPQVWINRRTTG